MLQDLKFAFRLLSRQRGFAGGWAKAKANQIHGARRNHLEAIIGANKPFEERGEAHSVADVGTQALDSVVTNHQPEFQPPENLSPAELVLRGSLEDFFQKKTPPQQIVKWVYFPKQTMNPLDQYKLTDKTL